MNNELAVVGAAIISEGVAFGEVNLRVADFESYGLQRVWAEIGRRLRSGEKVDLPTLNAVLKRDANLILDAVDACWSVDLAVSYAEQVRAAANARRLKEMAQLILDGNVADPLAYVNEQVALIEADSAQVAPTLIDEDLDDFLVAIQSAKAHATTGYNLLDSQLAGFKPGGFYVVGARPAVGKSVFGLSIAWRMARPANDLPAGEKAGLVVFASLEMSKTELMNRLMADKFGIRLELLERGKIDKPFADEINRRRAELKRLFAINDAPGQSIASIRAYAKNFVRKGMPLKAIVIDYLGLLKDVSEGRSLYESVSQTSTALKRLAKELGVPVIALAQLNRGVEHRSEKAPTLADLRDSGSIEQDADVVILLSRDKNDQKILLADIAKNRQGATSTIRYSFQGEFARLREM